MFILLRMSKCPLFISAGGESYCVYYTSSGSTYYTTVLNTDSTVDFSTTYRFTCYVRHNTFFLKIKVLKKSILVLKFTCPLYCSPVVDLIRLWRHQGQQCTPVIVKVSVRGPSPLQPNSPMGREHWCSPPMVCVEKSIILILRYVTSYKHSLWMKHRLSVRFFILFFIRFQWHVRLLLMNQVIDRF